jgi:hypothetical protein
MRWTLAVLLAAAALAQTPDQTQTFTFSHVAKPEQVREFVNTVRQMSKIRNVNVVAGQPAFTVTANPEQLRLISWLLTELDRPSESAPKPLVVHDYEYPKPRPPVVRIFRPARLSTPTELQETANAVRSLFEVERLTILTAGPAIAIGATQEQADGAEWLVRELDQPPEVRTRGFVIPSAPNGVVRLFFLPADTPVRTVLEKTRQLFTETGTGRIVACTSAPAILVRGTAEQVAIAERILR